MLGIWQDFMVTLIRQWIALKEVMALGMRDNFSGLSPDSVLSVLQRFALSRVDSIDTDTHSYSHLVQGRKEHLRTEMLKASLVRIWELARNELHNSPTQQANGNVSNRGAWHTVMANCNALYEPYTRNEQRELMAA